MLSILFAQTATATPLPAPAPAPAVDQYTTIIQAWQGLGLGMAVMFVLGLLILLGIGIVFYIFRPRSQSQFNATETMRQELVRALADERKEKEAVEQEKRRLEGLFAEGLSALSDANNRIADNGKQANELMKQRDDEQAKLANAINTIVNEGSKPLQEMAKTVTEMSARITRWDQIIPALPTLEAEIKHLRDEAEKRSTKPIPIVEAPVMVLEPEGIMP